MKIVDLNFLGHRRVIAAAVLDGPSALAVIDPGPTSTLPAFESALVSLGYRLSDVRDILLTHIHLDHAGAAGTLSARLPQATVYVHERGAPHMADPSKLLSSATRLYGSDMDRLWGEFKAVPASRMRVLSGGERIDLAGRTLEVAYTPGHASHHVSFFDLTDGTAYVGDTGGIRRTANYIGAPTPPPDIDLEAWEQSLRNIEAWRPSALMLTHFGVFTDVAEHLRRFRLVLEKAARRVKATLESEGTDEERIATFVNDMREDVKREMTAEEALSTEIAAPFAQLWMGLARYWRKKEENKK